MTDKEFEELFKWADENNLPQYLYKSEKDKTIIPIFPRDKEVLYKLEKLDLYDCKLLDIHPLIGKLVNIKELDIGINKFKELPEELCNLENLEILVMGYCKVKLLPNSFGKLKNLKILWLNNTSYLNKLPDSFCELESLEFLNLTDKNIKKLPDNFGNLCNLKTLYLYSSGLKTLPDSIGNLVNLEIFSISAYVTTVPNSICNLKKLKELNINIQAIKTENIKVWIEFLLNNGCKINQNMTQKYLDDMLILSRKSQQAWDVLYDWTNHFKFFDFKLLYSMKSLEARPMIGECTKLMNLKDDFKTIIDKEFYKVAETKKGGVYALWNYSDLKGEQPVIHFENNGNFEIVASSLEAFVVMFSLDEMIEKANVDFKYIREDRYLDSEDEAKKLFDKDVKKYRKIISSLFDVKTLEEYRNDIKKHEKFQDLVAYIEKK